MLGRPIVLSFSLLILFACTEDSQVREETILWEIEIDDEISILPDSISVSDQDGSIAVLAGPGEMGALDGFRRESSGNLYFLNNSGELLWAGSLQERGFTWFDNDNNVNTISSRWSATGDIIDNFYNSVSPVSPSLKNIKPAVDSDFNIIYPDSSTYLESYSPLRELKWRTPLDISLGASPIDVYTHIDSQDNVILIWFNQFLEDTGACPNTRLIIAKYSPEGESKWIKCLSGDSYFTTAGAASIVDSQDNICIIGRRASEVESEEDTWFFECFDPEGIELFVTDIGGSISGPRNIDFVTRDQDDNIYIIGRTIGRAPTPSTDIWVGKLHPSQEGVSSVVLVGPPDENERGVWATIDNNGCLLVAGIKNSDGLDSQNETSARLWVLKMDM